MTSELSNDLTAMTVDLLGAFVSNNNVRADDLPALIASTHAALAALNADPAAPEAETAAARPAPAVTARKSLGSREHIISMIDGKPYKTLKRHLSGHGMTPEQYRERYSLPASYPMVAPAYSEARRDTAKRLGLGRKPVVAAPAPVEESPAPAPAAKPARKAAAPKAAATKAATKPAAKPGRAKAAKPASE